MSALTKKEWMEFIEKTWDAAQKEAWSEPQFECPRCGHCCQAKGEEHMSENKNAKTPADDGQPVAFINVEKQKLEWAKLTSWHTPTIINLPKIPLYTAPPKREWVGLNHFDRTLLRTTYAPLKRLHHIKETNTDIVVEIVNDWDAFFTAIEAKLREKNTYDAAAAIRSIG
jgi:hypothetical protein